MTISETSQAKPPVSASEIERWMVDYITSVIDTPKDAFPVTDTFDTYGLDSVEITIMCGMIEEAFAIPIEPDELFAHPTVRDFSRHLAQKLQHKGDAAPPA